MFNWIDPYPTLNRIYHDHSYTFSDEHYKNSIKNYYLTPSFHNPTEIVTDNTENVDIETVDVDENSVSGHMNSFINLCDFTLKQLFSGYDNQFDFSNSKLDALGIDLQDKSKYLHLNKSDEWTTSDVNMKAKICFILDEAFGSLTISSQCNEQMERVNFNNIFRKFSKRINNVYSSLHWRMDICSHIHAQLLEYLPEELLVIYIECFRLLYQRRKIKTVVDQLQIWAQNQKIVQRFQWSTLVALTQRESEKMNECLTEFNWDLELKLKPLIIHIYSERWIDSVRMVNFSKTLKRFATVIDFPFDDSGRLRKKFEHLRNHLQMELKHKKSSLFVIGWDLGALLGLLSSIKIHGYFTSVFCGVICIGLPLKGLKGERGIIPEDYIHLLSKDTMIVSGDMSGIGNGDDIEDFKDRMKGRVSIRHVNIGGCDHLLRLSSAYAMRYRISQDTIDKLIIRNVRAFVKDQILNSYLKRDELTDFNQSRVMDYSTQFSVTDNSLYSFDNGCVDII